MAPKPVNGAVESGTFEVLARPGAFRSIRFSSSSIAISLICLFALGIFSIVDYREIALRRQQAVLSQSQANWATEKEKLSDWIQEKEKIFNGYLMMAGEFTEEGFGPTLANADSKELSFNEIQLAVERMEKRIRVLTDFQMKEEDYFWYVPSISPINLQEDFAIIPGDASLRRWTPGLSRVSSPHGMRVHPVTGHRHIHQGVDVTCPTGTDVRAAANGVITFAGSYTADQDNIRTNYGKFIVLRHGDSGFRTLYGHLSKILAQPGQLVKRGDRIALSGQTGRATGPHLHYEVIRNGVRVNPLNYIGDVPLFEHGKNVFYVKKNNQRGRRR